MKKRKPEREADRDEKGSLRVPAVPKARSSPNPVLDLQRAVGNRAVNELLGSKPGQTGFRVSQPGEPAEIQADRLSRQIAGGTDAETAESHAESAEPAAEVEGVTVDPATGLGPGQQMDASVRAGMEAHFGHDFSGVRIHSDPRAEESARSVGARAYTLGGDVVFGAGEYAPAKKEGKQLLAHELTHVIQQGAARPASPAAKHLAGSAPPGPAGKVIQRDSQKPPGSGSGAPASTAAPQTGPPQLTQDIYDRAMAILAKLPGADAKLVAILQKGKVGKQVSGVKVINAPPANPGDPPVQLTCDLEISPTLASLPQSAAARFVEDPRNQTNVQGDPAKGITITRLLKIIAKPAASDNEMAWSLLHEGMHMLLAIDRMLDQFAGIAPGLSTGATGAFKSFAQYQQAGKTSTKRAGLVSALVGEINRVKGLSAPPPPSAPAPSGKPPASAPSAPPPVTAPAGPSANDMAEDVIDEILEERFAFDQQLKQFPGSRTVTNSLLASAYMFDQLAFELGLQAWPTPTNQQALVTVMAAFLDDVELIVNPPAPPASSSQPKQSAPRLRNPSPASGRTFMASKAKPEQAQTGPPPARDTPEAGKAARSGHPFLGLQRTLGNQAVQQILGHDHPSSTSPVSAAAQPSQRKADPPPNRAGASSATPSSAPVRRACTCKGSAATAGKCAVCEEEDRLRRSSKEGGPAGQPTPAIVHDVLRSSGQPLEESVRSFMASRFGKDFREVRVSADDSSANAADAIQARAFTWGNRIAFGRNEYNPHSHSGLRLIAHELAHTAQQQGGTATLQPDLRIGSVSDPQEREADLAADAALRAQSVPQLNAGQSAVRRQPKGDDRGNGKATMKLFIQLRMTRSTPSLAASSR